MISFFKALIKRYGEDNLTARAAALAYFAVFSLGPLLFIILGILSIIGGSDVYKERVISQTADLTGPKAAESIEKLLSSEYLSQASGVALIAGGVGLILAAVGMFGQLQRSLNDIYRVKPGPASGWKTALGQKLAALTLVGVAGLLLLTSVISSMVISALRKSYSGDISYFISLADFASSILIISLMLAMIYRILPEVKLPLKLVFVSSTIVAIFFTAGTFALSLIISHNATISAFGAAGSLVALLLWIYYSGLIVYIGAAAVSLYADRHNIRFTPKYGGKRAAVRISVVEQPLDYSLTKQIEKKFKSGVKKGLSPKKK